MRSAHAFAARAAGAATLLLGVTALGPACESANENDAGPPETGLRMAMNTDPDDTHLMTLTGDTAVAWLFGTKDAQGAPSVVQSMVVDDTAGHQTIEATFGASGRPATISDSTGRAATFQYTDTAAVITFKGPNDVAETQTIGLDQLPGFPSGPPTTDTGSTSSALNAGERPILVVTHVRIVDAHGQPFKSLVDACVTGRITNKTLTYPAAYYPDPDGYVFTFTHRSQELDVGKAKCEALFGPAGTAVTHIGAGVASIAALCLLTPATAFCAAMLGWKGVLVGLALAGAGSTTTIASAKCADLVIPADPQQMTVTVSVTHPQFGSQTGTGSFDLSSAADPVTLGGRLDVSVDYLVKPEILAIGTDPIAPAAHESYRYTFSYTPPGATIDWSMVGSDHYEQSGTAFGGATGTTAKSEPVPGGGTSVEDTVTADLMVGDTVAVEKKWSFKFR